MKQTMSVFLVVLLVLSIMPIALAEETEEKEGLTNKYGIINNNKYGVVKNKVGEVDKNKFREENKEDIKHKYEITKKQVIKNKEKYMEVKKDYKNVQNNYKEAKTKWGIVKESSTRCREDESEKCTQVRKTVKVESKEFLIKSSERVLTILENLKEKIESSKNLEEEIKQERLEEIKQSISEVTESKEIIENLNNESTLEEIKEASQTLNNAWKTSQKTAKVGVGRLANAKIGGIIIKSEKLDERLNKIVGEMEKNGQDTEEVKSLIEDFNEKVGFAKENHEKARKKYSEANSPNKVDNVMNEAHEFMKISHNHLKESHKLLKDIVREARPKQPSE
jgi:chromosome segregation ATPase